MRNLVLYPRVLRSRTLRRIVPALGVLSLCLMTGDLIVRPPMNLPTQEAAASAIDTADLRDSYSGDSIFADIGPHTPGAFAPRSAAVSSGFFVTLAEAAPASAPLPPERPAALQSDKAAAVEPAAEAARIVADVPLPPRRPAELMAALRPEAPKEARPQTAALAPVPPETLPAPRTRMARTTAVPAAPADNRGFFERLFGGAPQAAAPAATSRPGQQAMAYASTSDAGGLFGGLHSAVAPSNPAARYDRYTAVYDISARTVYLPSGARLEAHSGLGPHLDDPRYVNLRMRGAAPPHLYDLRPREALFHGVEALRLNPVGGSGAIYNRAGLLAHTYMLGPNGDSNGCVSFRDYNAFLSAYKRGEIRRLAVVSHL